MAFFKPDPSDIRVARRAIHREALIRGSVFIAQRAEPAAIAAMDELVDEGVATRSGDRGVAITDDTDVYRASRAVMLALEDNGGTIAVDNLAERIAHTDATTAAALGYIRGHKLVALRDGTLNDLTGDELRGRKSALPVESIELAAIERTARAVRKNVEALGESLGWFAHPTDDRWTPEALREIRTSTNAAYRALTPGRRWTEERFRRDTAIITADHVDEVMARLEAALFITVTDGWVSAHAALPEPKPIEQKADTATTTPAPSGVITADDVLAAAAKGCLSVETLRKLADHHGVPFDAVKVVVNDLTTADKMYKSDGVYWLKTAPKPAPAETPKSAEQKPEPEGTAPAPKPEVVETPPETAPKPEGTGPLAPASGQTHEGKKSEPADTETPDPAPAETPISGDIERRLAALEKTAETTVDGVRAIYTKTERIESLVSDTSVDRSRIEEAPEAVRDVLITIAAKLHHAAISAAKDAADGKTTDPTLTNNEVKKSLSWRPRSGETVAPRDRFEEARQLGLRTGVIRTAHRSRLAFVSFEPLMEGDDFTHRLANMGVRVAARTKGLVNAAASRVERASR